MAAPSAWLGVDAADYELHMARIGQAEANARLTASWLSSLDAAQPVLFAGSGPGQMLEYLPPLLLHGRGVTFSDINPSFLALAGRRLESHNVVARLVTDNIEDSTLADAQPNVIIALVLEHVRWRTALQSLRRWRTQNALIIIQENPPQIDAAVTPGREVPGTMQVFRDTARPHLIPETELHAVMSELGFEVAGRDEALVADGKKMIACRFATSKTATAS
jgi:SAM-dependent methyltransferase